MTSILIVDDEPNIRRTLRAVLEQNQFEVLIAAHGEEGLDLAACKTPDLVLLDLAMPIKSGFQVCRELREWSSVPIIALSVLHEEEDKVRILELGADDYITKPFGVKELIARIKAVLRRMGETKEKTETTFECAGLLVDFAHRRVTVNQQEVHLTPKEYDLLRHLIAHRDQVLTHKQLLGRIWGAQYEHDSHTLRVHIANLRNKIEKHPECPTLITTETGIGYRLRSGAY